MTMSVWTKDLQCIKIGFHPKSIAIEGKRPGRPYLMDLGAWKVIEKWWDRVAENRPSAQHAVEEWGKVSGVAA